MPQVTYEAMLYRFWENNHKTKTAEWKMLELLSQTKPPIYPKKLEQIYTQKYGDKAAREAYKVDDKYPMFISVVEEKTPKPYITYRWYHYDQEQIADFLKLCETLNKEREKRDVKCIAMRQEAIQMFGYYVIKGKGCRFNAI